MPPLHAFLPLPTILLSTVLLACLTASAWGDDPLTLDAQVTLSTNLTVSATSEGTVQLLPISEGQHLRTGALIAQLDDRRARAELAVATQALHSAQLESENDVDRRFASKSLTVQQQELEKSRAANDRFAGSVSDTEMRRKQLTIEQARLQIEQSERDAEVRRANVAQREAAVETARLAVELHTINSPIDGVVAERFVSAGEWVAAGAPLVRVIDLTRLRIECFISEADAASLPLGSALTFQPLSDPERQYSGTLQFIAPELHPVTNQARLWAEVHNEDGKLKPGMQGKLIVQAP